MARGSSYNKSISYEPSYAPSYSASYGESLIGLPPGLYFADNAKANQYFADSAKTSPYNYIAEGTVKLPGDVVVALFGDSLEQHMGVASASVGSEEFSYWSRGYMNWTQMLDPRGRWINWYDASQTSKFYIGQDVGISGNTTTQMIGRITDLTSIRGCKLAIIGGGTNDINEDDPIATIKSNLSSCYAAAIAAGMKVIIVTPPPRTTGGANSWASGSAERLAWMALSIWMQQQADANPSNIKIVRRDMICANDDADLSPVTGYLQSDNVHLTPLGGYAVAVGRTGWPGLVEVMSQWVNSFTLFPAGVQAGDLAPNPTCTGTAGTISTGATGTAPDNMRLQRAAVTGNGAGVSVVGSQETVSGIVYQKMVFTRDGTGGTATFNLDKIGNITVTGAGAAEPGTWYRGWMQFKANASAAFQSISLRARGQPTTPANMDAQSMKTDTGLPWPTAAFQKADGSPLWQSCPPIKLRPGTTSILWGAIIILDNTAAGTDTVWISRMQLVPVGEPTQPLGYE